MFLSNDGYCCICDAPTTFESEHDWLRDHYKCQRCGTIPRARALVHVLNIVAPDWRTLATHESSPGSRFFADRCERYSYSFFYEGVPLGTKKDGNPCESVEELTFPSESFDLFITQDVMEHVFHPARAFAEISRVLRPGGLHVFTAPRHKRLIRSVYRASLEDGKIRHHLPPEYHGNPISEKGSLVTWDYGADFEERIQGWSGYCTSTFNIRDRGIGIDGEFLDVFVTRKDVANAL
jgi:SAM-dependent methyltransferase